MLTGKQLFVSVIIPTYNRAAFIKPALESIFEQTYSSGDMEIIVVDDGSTDNTREIIEGHRNDVVYIGQENKGIAGARNSGIKIARGDLVTFLDSDDIFDKTRIEKVVQAFIKNPTAGMVYHPIELIDKCGRTLHRNFYDAFGYRPGLDGWVTDEIFSGAIFCGGSSFTFRKSVIEKIYPIPEDIHMGADYYMSALASCLAPVAFASEVLGKYRLHGNNITILGSEIDRGKLAGINESFAHMRKRLIGRIESLGLDPGRADLDIIRRLRAKEMVLCSLLRGRRIEGMMQIPALFAGKKKARDMLRGVAIGSMAICLPTFLYPKMLRMYRLLNGLKMIRFDKIDK